MVSVVPVQHADPVVVVFFKTAAPVDPVALVKRICQDAIDEPSRKRTRFVKRLSPMTLMDRASEEGLEKVSREVLAPHFHQQPFQAQKVSHSRHLLSARRSVRTLADCLAPIGDAMSGLD